ncbi:MAG: hypothetical protein D6677_09985 [Calditrichaeota bacterium]|nr:MAG: hypothetical protein D6677_09985 [Calditrichota bacterium]
MEILFLKRLSAMQQIRSFLLSLLILPLLMRAADTEVAQITLKSTIRTDNDALMEIIRLREDDPFEPRLLKLDKILLSNYFRKQGYINVEVRDSIRFSRNREKVYVTYAIQTGARYYLNSVTFLGNKDVDSLRIAAHVMNAITLGLPFDESVVGVIKQRLEDLYYNSGKPFVEIAYDYYFTRDTLIDVRFDIQENQTVYIGAVRYLGLDKVKSFIVRRELEIKKGDLYNRKKLDRSQQNIYGTGLFQFVRFELEPDTSDRSRVNLLIRLKEKPARWVGFYIGLAYEQQEFFGGKAEFTLEGGHRNLWGNGRAISLHLTPALMYDPNENKLINAENEITLKFVEPWIGYTRTPGVLQVSYHQFRRPNSGDFDLIRSSFEVHHKFDRYEFNASLSAKSLKQIDNEAIDLSGIQDFDAGQSQIYGISLYGKRDTRKNLFNPRNGALNDLSISFSQSMGKVDAQTEINRFITIISSWQRYQPWKPYFFGKRHKWVLASRIKAGIIYELEGNKSIPISERFYAGGATTVRGYEEQLLGPAAAVNDKGQIVTAAGGKAIFLANIEGRIPLFWLLVGEVFVDAGNVWSELSRFRPDEIRLSTGIGLALITPLGPIRVDYGYKLTPQKTDPTPDAFHIGIYFAF